MPRDHDLIPRPHERPQRDSTLRVLVVLNSYQQDGPGKLMLQVCGRLAAEPGLAIETVALSRGGPLENSFRAIGIRAEVVPTRGPGGLRRLARWADDVSHRATAPRIVHTNLLWPDLVVRLVKSRLGRVRLSSTIHGLHARGEKGQLAGMAYHALDKMTRSRVDAFVAISAHVRETMLADGYPARRVHVIPNGVDAVQMFPLAAGSRQKLRHLMNVPDGPLIVSAGQLIERKGVWDTLAAFEVVAREVPSATLVFVGSGPLRDELESRAQAMGVRERVRFIGHLSVMLPQVLGAADVVVHASHDEPFGLVAAEAMAVGAPTVVANVGGLREIFHDKQTGLSVPPRDPQAIAGAVLRLLRSPDEARRMGEAAREFIVSNFEVGRTAENYHALWRQLSGGRTSLESSESAELQRIAPRAH